MKGKVGLSQVGRKAVPQPWSSNLECPIAETSVGSWNNERSFSALSWNNYAWLSVMTPGSQFYGWTNCQKGPINIRYLVPFRPEADLKKMAGYPVHRYLHPMKSLCSRPLRRSYRRSSQSALPDKISWSVTCTEVTLSFASSRIWHDQSTTTIVSCEFLWIRRTCDYIWLSVHYCMLFSSGVRVRIGLD